MPEANFGIYAYAPVEASKHLPILKASGGIGDTDGFPAFDVESENYAAPEDPKWGFRITGGAQFHMPITVFQVTENGLADKGGIRLGDIIVQINEIDVTNLPLAKVQEIIDSSTKKIFMIARGMGDDEYNENPQEEEKAITLRIPKPMPPPKEFTPTPLLGTRVWHPIMWQEPPAPPKEKKHKTKTEIVDGEEVVIELSEEESSDEEEEELPHHRIIRNIRRFFTENKDNEELRSRTIEDMLLILPGASKSK